MEEGHVFISYSRKDKKEVDWIARQLVGAGFEIWIDRHDIQGGAEWLKEILRAIKSAEKFIIVLSENSIASTEVNRELNEAIKNKRTIIPVILKPIDMDWLVEKKISKLQIITYYRRRQASITDLVKSMGGLRGIASIMPSKSNLVIRENARLIAELIRLIQEVSFDVSHVILNRFIDDPIYIQISGVRDEPEIRAEAAGNVNLPDEEKLSEQSIASLMTLGWNKPDKTSYGNYWKEWKVYTDQDRATVAATIIATFLQTYNHYSGEYISVSKIWLN